MTLKKSRKLAKVAVAQSQSMPVPLTVEPSMIGKLKQPKLFIPLIIIALIILGFVFKGLFVAVLVNGEPITRLAVVRALEKQGGKQILSSMVNQVLILQEAKKKNVQVSQAEIDKSVKQVEDSLKGQGQNLDAALAAQGMTKQELIMQLKLRTLVEKLLADKIKVTDKEIADYIEKNKDTFPADMKEPDIKKGVEEQLKQQKMAAASQTWLEELNKSAKIYSFVNY